MGRESEKVVGNTLERPISRSRNSSCPTEVRSELRRETAAMGGGHGGGNTYRGMTLHAPKRWHSVTGKGLCAIMWSVSFLRFFFFFFKKSPDMKLLWDLGFEVFWHDPFGIFLVLFFVDSVRGSNILMDCAGC